MFKIANRLQSSLRPIALFQTSTSGFSHFYPPDMKVLIADQFSESGIDQMKKAGLGVTYNPELAG